MVNVLTSALFVAVLVAAIAWLGPRQPQWVSRDGTRFIAMACKVDDGDGRPGRWLRTHGRIDGDLVRLRQGFLAAGTLSGTYTMVEPEQSTDPRFAVFTVGTVNRVHLKVRRNSPLVGTLGAMIRDR